MQALVMTAINELQLHDVPVPTLEQPDWALLRVRASGICGSDLHGYTGQTGRRHPPIVMGHEATADVVAVGAAVRDVRVGDRVAVLPLYDTTGSGQAKDRLGMGMNAPGAYAEYVTWPASQLFVLPPELSYEAGALAEPLAVAVRAVTLASLKPYDTAFVAGAGPIGLLTLAVLRAGVAHGHAAQAT
jgi:L-iditol 2-dehydrogenase